MQLHTRDTLQERAYAGHATHTTDRFSTPTRRVLSDREPYTTGWKPCLSRRVCLITRPHCWNDLSGDDRDGRAAASIEKKGCTVALCADGAGLLPADVSPLSGDIIFNSLVAYTMGTGRIRMPPGKQAEKDRGRPKLKEGVTIRLSPRYWWSCSSTVFGWAMPRMIVLKTGRAISAPDSPEGMGTTPFLAGTLVF